MLVRYQACMFWLAWEGGVNMETGEIELPKKPRSKQHWPSYNRGQSTEGLRLPQFLYSLCLDIPDARMSGTSGRTGSARVATCAPHSPGWSGSRASAWVGTTAY